PCTADPLSNDELRKLGVFWIENTGAAPQNFRRPLPGGPQNVFVTRLHLRYDSAHFPEDLVFQETGDRGNFQGRYVLRHPWTGKATCEAAERYRESLRARVKQEAGTLASLTGWPIEEIRRKVGALPGVAGRTWWQKLYGQ